MPNRTLTALAAIALTATTVSAQASLADRKSDEDRTQPAISAPYSGQIVSGGEVVVPTSGQ